MPNTIAKIVDIETDAILGPGQQGELCVSGPQVNREITPSPQGGRVKREKEKEYFNEKIEIRKI